MRKKRKDIDTANTGRMTDAALSKKLGRCQLVEDISILLGVVLLIGASISAFVLRNVLLLAALCFVGVGLILLVGMPAQKKKKALIQQQLGDFFRMELNRVFGPEPQTPELPLIRPRWHLSGSFLSLGRSVMWRTSTKAFTTAFIFPPRMWRCAVSRKPAALRVMRRPESRHCSAASSFGAADKDHLDVLF